jgi:hypothetical protein
MNAQQAYRVARLADPKACEVIEDAFGCFATDVQHYAQTVLSGFADRALDAAQPAPSPAPR